MALGALGAGLLKGLVAKKQYEQQLEQQNLQKELFKLKLQEQKQSQDFINTILSEAQRQRESQQGNSVPDTSIEPGKTPDTQFGMSFDNGAVLPDTMNGMPIPGQPQHKQGGVLDYIMSLDPVTQSIIGKKFGVDFMGAGRLAEQQRGNDIREAGFERGETEGNYVDTVNEQGEPVKRWVPKYLSPGQQQRPDIPAVPQFETYKMQDESGATVEGIRNKRTGIDVVKPRQVEPPKGAPAETAGKVAMSVGAVDYGKQLEAMIIDPKTGKINRKLILQANTPMGGIGQGRLVKSLFRDAMDARIRASTGAAINAEEIPYYESVYFPHPLDGDELVKDKFKRMQEFLGAYLETIDPDSVHRKRIKAQQNNDGWIIEEVTE